MRKSFIIAGIFAAMLVAGCDNKDDASGTGNTSLNGDEVVIGHHMIPAHVIYVATGGNQILAPRQIPDLYSIDIVLSDPNFADVEGSKNIEVAQPAYDELKIGQKIHFSANATCSELPNNGGCKIFRINVYEVTP